MDVALNCMQECAIVDKNEYMLQEARGFWGEASHRIEPCLTNSPSLAVVKLRVAAGPLPPLVLAKTSQT